MIIIIEAKLAHGILNDLPLSVISVILSDDWAGGALISLKDQMSRPSAEEIATNAMWLLPMVKDSPRKARFWFKKYDTWSMFFENPYRLDRV